MDLSDLPKDVLMLLALEMDIEYIINLCQTSSLFNNKICKNNYFWMNKLFKEFGIQTNIYEAKNEYLSIINILKTEPNRILNSGIITENYKLVKAAIEKGANPNEKLNSYYPVVLSMSNNNNDEISVYLLSKTNFDSVYFIIKDFYDKFNTTSSRSKKCKIFIKLFTIFLPYASKFMDKIKYRPFWNQAVSKLEEINKTDKDCVTDEIYNKWIPFYRELAQ